MTSKANSNFWKCYRRLPQAVQKAATKQFRMWLNDAHHPSVQFKKVGGAWSARVTDDYRALAVMKDDCVTWFWIGSHAEYDQLLRGR